MRSDSSYRVPVIPPSPRFSLSTTVALVTLTALATTGGCSASPEPKPTPTPLFASEEEAFAAAEEVYREYNEAVNAERRGASEPDPRDYLIGLALEGDTDARNELRDRGLTIDGDGLVAAFDEEEVELAPSPRVVAIACLDVSGTRVLDQTGQDVTPAEREAHVPLQVTMLTRGDTWAISESTSAAGTTC